MVTEVSAAPLMPPLQSVQRAMALPTVEAAVGQVGALYTRVKGAHSLLEWALSSAEAGVTLAATTAAPYVAAPLAGADARVAAAIEQLEKRVPLVAEEPKVIVETTKQAVLSRVSPHVNKVCGVKAAAGQRVRTLKDLSWSKANALLSTAYGQKAVDGVDSGAMFAMQMLDHYLPAPPTSNQPDAESNNEIVAATSDPAMHTMQTVGRLSAVAARRVWANLAYRVHELRKSGIELDVRRYLAALLAALHLADVTRQQQPPQTTDPSQPQTQQPSQQQSQQSSQKQPQPQPSQQQPSQQQPSQQQSKPLQQTSKQQKPKNNPKTEKTKPNEDNN